MNPKKCAGKTKVWLAVLVSGAGMIGFGQTNWPAYRQVKGQVYNVALARGWTTIIPSGGKVKMFAGVRPGQPVVIEAANGVDRIEVQRVPYNAGEFDFVPHKEPVLKRGVIWRVFWLENRTNYTGNGTVGSVTKVYDYGVPVGTKEK